MSNSNTIHHEGSDGLDGHEIHKDRNSDFKNPWEGMAMAE